MTSKHSGLGCQASISGARALVLAVCYCLRNKIFYLYLALAPIRVLFISPGKLFIITCCETDLWDRIYFFQAVIGGGPTASRNLRIYGIPCFQDLQRSPMQYRVTSKRTGRDLLTTGYSQDQSTFLRFRTQTYAAQLSLSCLSPALTFRLKKQNVDDVPSVSI